MRLLIIAIMALSGMTLWALIAGWVAWMIDPAFWWWPTIAFGAFLLEAIVGIVAVAIDDLGGNP